MPVISFTYTFVTGTGSDDNGSFVIDAGVLKTNASFNFEAKNSYTVRVRSTDAGGLFTEKPFTIGVTNVNETPTEHHPLPHLPLRKINQRTPVSVL